MKPFRFGSRLCPEIWLCSCIYSVSALLRGSFHLNIPSWVELMPSGRSLGCTCGLSHVRPLRWRCVAVQEWQHPAEDLWSLHLAGKVASVVAQRVILRCPQNQLRLLPCWLGSWMMLSGLVWHHCRRPCLWPCSAVEPLAPSPTCRLIPRVTLPSSLWTCPCLTLTVS